MIVITATGQQYTLVQGENFIGRGNECNLRLNTEKASRRHAVIRWDGRQAFITDLGSTNGTRLNGESLTANRPYALNPGDHLELGGPDARLDVGLSSVALPAVTPAPLPEPAQPPGNATHAERRLPLWVLALGGAALLLLIAAAALLLLKPPAKSVSTTTAVATPVPIIGTAVVIATQVSQVVQPAATALTAPKVAVPTVAAPAAKVGGVSGGTGAVPARPQMPAQMPPINPTSMPDMVNALLQQFGAGSGGALPAIGALLPGLTGGTALPGLGGVVPGSGLPVGPKRYAAPVLKAPADGASFQGEGATIILEWNPVENLAPNDYYFVMVFYKPGGREEIGGSWMKETSYRVPSWFAQQYFGRYEWQVVISEATGLPENGGKLGARVSDPSAKWSFTWDSGGGGQPPEPPASAPGPTPTYGG
jgi:pSer/pThr/pTyr-binding forkhead associated (FHA) protein